MVEVWLPYGNTEICLTVSSDNLLGIIEPKPTLPPSDLKAELKKTMENPLGSARLSKIAKPGSKVAIALDKSVTGIPTPYVLSSIVNELELAEVKRQDITVILGDGTGKPLTGEEVKQLLVEPIPDLPIEINDPENEEKTVEVGATEHRTRVLLNKKFVEADMRILIGRIGPHPYAGYSGGRQTVITAISGIRTLHHNYTLSVDHNSRVGNLENNPVHLDMVEVANIAKIDFTLDFVADREFNDVKVFGGNLESAFTEGVKYLESHYCVTVQEKADVVVVSPGGQSYDSNLYDAQESIERALRIVRDGGVILMVAECSKGYGPSDFYRWVKELDSMEALKIAIRKQFTYGLHKVAQLLHTHSNVKVVMVSTLPETISNGVFNFKEAKSAGDGLDAAYRLVGRRSKVWVLPRAMETLPSLVTREAPH
jgi:nickel-dependent lactate racemase